MWIKFKVEGELEELIKAESEDECRTCSQQALHDSRILDYPR